MELAGRMAMSPESRRQLDAAVVVDECDCEAVEGTGGVEAMDADDADMAGTQCRSGDVTSRSAASSERREEGGVHRCSCVVTM
jgi:hypothetical protein